MSFTGSQRDSVRSFQARAVRQVAPERHRHGVQTVAGHEGARAAVHALVQAQHQGAHAAGERLGALQPGPGRGGGATGLRRRRGALGTLGRNQSGTAFRSHL